MIRRDQAEKMEIIHLVEHSTLSVKRTLEELNVPRTTFYRWYQRYQADGETGLIDQRPNPRRIWPEFPRRFVSFGYRAKSQNECKGPTTSTK